MRCLPEPAPNSLRILRGLCVTWLLLVLPDAARAHRVYLFAWDEAGRVCSESYYSKTARITDAVLTVRDAEGKELLRGRSDSDGRFCFPRPSAAELLLSVDAGQGHRGEFRLSATPPPPFARSEESGVPPDSERRTAVPDEHEACLRRIVREELERVLPLLPPQHRQTPLRSGREEEPGLREILGGLGWIAGLAALFAWYRSRRAS